MVAMAIVDLLLDAFPCGEAHMLSAFHTVPPSPCFFMKLAQKLVHVPSSYVMTSSKVVFK